MANQQIKVRGDRGQPLNWEKIVSIQGLTPHLYWFPCPFSCISCVSWLKSFVVTRIKISLTGLLKMGLEMIKKVVIALMVALCTLYIFGCSAPKIIGGSIQTDVLIDGVYEGEARNGPVKVIAEVIIQDQKITKINLLKHSNWKGKAAEKAVLVRIVEEQSTNVDAVSGATMSSVTIMNAVEDAISKARQKL